MDGAILRAEDAVAAGGLRDDFFATPRPYWTWRTHSLRAASPLLTTRHAKSVRYKLLLKNSLSTVHQWTVPVIWLVIVGQVQKNLRADWQSALLISKGTGRISNPPQVSNLPHRAVEITGTVH